MMLQVDPKGKKSSLQLYHNILDDKCSLGDEQISSSLVSCNVIPSVLGLSNPHAVKFLSSHAAALEPDPVDFTFPVAFVLKYDKCKPYQNRKASDGCDGWKRSIVNV